MKHLRPYSIALLIPVLCVAFTALSGCGGGATKKDKGTSIKSREKGEGGDAKTAEYKPLEGKGSGTLTGKVMYDGTPPALVPIATMESHQDKDLCLAGSEQEKVEQKWLVSKDGGVANVVVFLEPPDGYYFKLKPDETNLKGKFAEIDQPHCAFVPHVLAYYAGYYDPEIGDDQVTGMKLLVKNSAAKAHNTKYKGGDNTIPPGGSKEVPLSYNRDAPTRLECSIHTWMNAYVWALDTPYHAVSKDDGTFEIKGIPTGVKARVFVWHEAKGFLNEFGGAEGKLMDLTDGMKLDDIKIK